MGKGKKGDVVFIISVTFHFPYVCCFVNIFKRRRRLYLDLQDIKWDCLSSHDGKCSISDVSARRQGGSGHVVKNQQHSPHHTHSHTHTHSCLSTNSRLRKKRHSPSRCSGNTERRRITELLNKHSGRLGYGLEGKALAKRSSCWVSIIYFLDDH